MIITIKNDNGETVYDVSKIENNDSRMNATISVDKIGTLNTLVEALNFATQGHQGNLEKLLADCPEALLEKPTEEEETSTEDDSLNEVS